MINLLLQYIASRVYKRIGNYQLEVSTYLGDYDFKDIQSLIFKPIEVGQSWGTLFERAWFKATLKPISLDINPSLKYAILIDVGGEGLVYDEMGQCVMGITNKMSSYGIPPDKPGKWVVPIDMNRIDKFYVDASCNDLFGYVQDGGRIQEASLAIIDDVWHKLFYDIEVLTDWAYGINDKGSHQPSKNHHLEPSYNPVILKLLADVEHLIKTENPKDFQQAIALLAEFYSLKSDQDELTIYATGHAHLDIAWLWSIGEGRRKARRTFSTALKMMERYPNYVFGASQYQLLDWIQQDEPALFRSIQAKVQQNKFEPQGVFWVECDLNLPSLESLIRQIFYGKQFLKNNFDQDVDFVWEPDVFGLSGALPQILLKSGIDVVLSQKLSQNRINPFPHHSFLWSGIDGSTVLVHHFPEETYDSRMRPASLIKLVQQYKEKDTVPTALMVFGVGDGGGGPGEEHLERFNRIHNLKSLPKVQIGTVKQFIQEFKKYKPYLKTVSGELYFERHQGTYTTEVLNKIGNETMERLLLYYEQLAAWLYWFEGKFINQTMLDDLWKEVLLYQFHDILPGSSIVPVYLHTRQRYLEMIEILYDQIEQLKSQVFNRYVSNGFQVYNPTGYPRTEWIKHNHTWYHYLVQPYGFQTPDHPTYPWRPRIKNQLNNGLIQLIIRNDGSFHSLINLTSGHEYIDPSRVEPMWTIYHELSHEYPAWDFADEYRKGQQGHPKVKSMDMHTDGPLQQITIHYGYSQSSWSMIIQLYEGASWIKCICEMDWHDINTSVKWHIPITIQTDQATCHMQYGHIMRPTHYNDSHAIAKDEIYAHQFIDVSDSHRGIALMSPQKYGYRVKDQALEMSILRSQKKNGSELGFKPDPNYPENHYGDLVKHQFEFGLYPHEGVDLIEVETIANTLKHQIWEFDQHQAGMEVPEQLFSIHNKAVVIQSVKFAYDHHGIILRITELSGQPQVCTIETALALDSVWLCDLLENPIHEMALVDIKLNAFEILTIKLIKGAHI